MKTEMKNTVTLWKVSSPYGYRWSIEDIEDDWNGMTSEPYEVEIPEGFYIGETDCSMKMFFSPGANTGFEVCTFSNRKNANPYICNAMADKRVENAIKLRVIRRL